MQLKEGKDITYSISCLKQTNPKQKQRRRRKITISSRKGRKEQRGELLLTFQFKNRFILFLFPSHQGEYEQREMTKKETERPTSKASFWSVFSGVLGFDRKIPIVFQKAVN
jgi:hypothetical protein